MPLEEEERLARKKKTDFQDALALSREEVRHSGLAATSPKTPAEPIHAMLAELVQVIPTEPAHVVDVKGDTLSPVLVPRRGPSVLALQEATRCRGEGPPKVATGPQMTRQDIDEEASRDRELMSQHLAELVATPTPVATRGDKEIFWRPFDVEARVLKILNDLLPVQSRSIRESNALGQAMPLDMEGCGLIEWMLLEFLLNIWWELMDLEESILLIDGCASRAKYHYHVLKESVPATLGHPCAKDFFGVSCIMDEEERLRVIAAEKCPEEAVVTQTTKEVM
ncbi:hypothetical protein ACLOJK_019031 [Asimina triloba]